MNQPLLRLRRWCDALPASQRLAVALALIASAVAMRHALFPAESGLPYLTFYPAVVVAFMLLGNAAGMLVTLLCAATAYYTYLHPELTWEPTRDRITATILFLLSCALIGKMSLDLRRLQRESQASEQRFRSFLNAQLDLFCRYQADGTIRYVNDAWCREFGVERADVVGRPWQPVAWHEDLGHINEQLAGLTPDNPVVTIVNRVVTATQGVVWRQFTHQAFFDERGQIREIQSVGHDIHDRQMLAEQLATTAAQMQDLYDHAPCGYHSLDEHGIFLNVNETELGWLGCTRAELIGRRSPADFYTEESRARFASTYLRFKEEGHVNDLEFDLVGGNGAVRRVSINAIVVRGEDGGFRYTRSIMHDVTERARAEARVVAESARFKAFLRVSTDGVHILDSHAQLVEASDSFFAMLGYEREELLGARPDKWDAKVDLEANRMQVLTGVLWKFETCHRRKDGTFIDVEVNTEGFHYDGAQYLFCASRDISDRKLSERRIVHLATHDALTGLPNRTLLRDRLARSLSQALRDGTSGALLMLDLDGFKLVNDQYGHEAGDKVLQVVASRLYRLVRDSDSVARLGGDEFAIVLDAISGEQAIRAFAGQVIQQVSLPVALDNGTPVSVGASVGAAPFPATGSNRRALLAAADRAMYVSKHAGHNLCTVSTDVSDPEEPGSQLFNAGLLPDLGLSGMDLAHESLASMLTGIEVAMAAGAARPVLLQLLDDVTAVASSHFREEERWMEQAGYPDIEAHELAHAQLLDEFAKLRSGTAAGSNNSPVKALKDWLMIHMEAFDQPLAQFLLAGQEPGKAPA